MPIYPEYLLKTGFEIPLAIEMTPARAPNGPIFRDGVMSHWVWDQQVIPMGWFHEAGIQLLPEPPWFREPQDRMIFLDHINEIIRLKQPNEGHIRINHNVATNENIYEVYHLGKWYRISAVDSQDLRWQV